MSNIDIVKYLSIPFKHLGRDWNGCDCLGLSKLFYEHELNKIFPDFYYEQGLKNSNPDFMIEKIENNNFVIIDNPEKYCLVTFKKFGEKIVNHMGIMLDETRFLHIPRNKLPVISKLTNPVWERRFYGFFKLKENV